MPQHYKNLVIVGTSHIAEHSLTEIEAIFYKEDPDIVAVELDRNRLHALLSDQKPNYSLGLIKVLGFKGYLFAIIGGALQQKLGDIVGVKPGSDMLKAVRLAQKNNKQIALIDRDVRVTLVRLSKALRWKEKLHFTIDFFIAPFSKKMKINLSQIPEKQLITRVLNLMKRRYPGIHKVLVVERNRLMAFKLKALMEQHEDKKILVVVGAGHEEEILSLIKTHKV